MLAIESIFIKRVSVFMAFYTLEVFPDRFLIVSLCIFRTPNSNIFQGAVFDLCFGSALLLSNSYEIL